MAGRIALLAAGRRSLMASVPHRQCSTMNIAGSKKLTDWEKRVMVWGGGFKSRAEVPTEVPHAQFQKCQERFRIKMNIYCIAATLGACGVMIYLGQIDSETGASLHERVLEKHAAGKV